MSGEELRQKLVDLYAGRELPIELEAELEEAAMKDPVLAHDMFSLRRTVDMLQSDNGAAFTEESFQRILIRMQAKGARVEPQSPEPAYWQYHLPIQG